MVGLWKHALTAISEDEGKTWTTPVRAPGFVNSNAKIWGQKTSDGKYATVYNPSDFRWPLAISVSDDGLAYDKLLLVNGEITTMRYGGATTNHMGHNMCMASRKGMAHPLTKTFGYHTV